ncbi:uncharacterized protein LOC123530133 [Mercenaria mercenaria]|uniref:uncharacterized protein LOC123530133 n=1 Tax=Mercenaria mercenaria TaxID=6596 RepID=UPI00234F167E|nr:uncharacterized protein LOC123530133 [Mercenaria mercenaria]
MFSAVWITFILTYGSVLSLPHLDLTVDFPLAENNNDDILLGSKTSHKAVLNFQNETLEGVVVEILGAEKTTFAIGAEPIVNIGTDLTVLTEAQGQIIEVTSSNYYYFMEKFIGPEYTDPSLPIRYETGLVLNFGNITGVDNSSDSQIEIDIEYFYVSIAGYDDRTENFSSIVVEYSVGEGNFLIIGQIKYSLRTETVHITELESFTVETTEDPVRGLPSVDLLMNVPFPVSQLQVEVAVKNSSNKDVVVSEMRMKTIGNSFLSVDAEKIQSFAYSECPLGTSLVLDCGRIINKDAWEDPENSDLNIIGVEIILQALNKKLNGSEIEFVIAIFIDQVAIWLGDLNLTVAYGPPTPLEFATYSTTALSGFKVPSPGFPGVAEITMRIPEITANDYKFSFTTSAVSASENALSILGISLNAAGKNIDCDTRTTSTIALTLSESKPGSGLFDNGTLTVAIANHGLQTKPTEESNIVKFNVYLKMLPNAVEGETHRLTVNLNDFEAQNVDFTVGKEASYSKTTYYDDVIEHGCATETFYLDTTMKFTMNVTTDRNSVVGPVTYETAIPGAFPVLKFESAKTIWRGRNVGCVNPGDIKAVLSDWIEGAKEQDGAFLTFPLVCNVEVVDSAIEDTLLIEINVRILNLEIFREQDTPNHKFLMQRSALGASKDFYKNFNTKIPVDLSRTMKINGVKIPQGGESVLVNGALSHRLQWSENNIDFHDYNHNWDSGTGTSNGSVFTADRPLYARYVRMKMADSGCTTDFEPEASDFGEDIDFYGKEFSKKEMLQNVMYVLDGDENTCKALPTQTTTETVQYYWTDIDTHVLNTGTTSAFNVQLIGKGLACAGGHQVIKVMHPKNAATGNFSGFWIKCVLVEQLDGTPMSCTYKCACFDETTCASVSLLLYYKGIPTEPYEICEIKIVP